MKDFDLIGIQILPVQFIFFSVSRMLDHIFIKVPYSSLIVCLVATELSKQSLISDDNSVLHHSKFVYKFSKLVTERSLDHYVPNLATWN